MWRAVIFRSLKGRRREDENKKKLKEGHKYDNSSGLHNLCRISAAFQAGMDFFLKPNLCDLLSSAKQLLNHKNTKQSERGFAR